MDKSQFQRTLLEKNTVMKLHKWSAKCHLKSVGMFECQVTKEKREGWRERGRKRNRREVQGRTKGEE